MSAYHLFAVDSAGHSMHMSHIHGKPCLHIPDDEPVTIVLEHPTCATLIELAADGNFEVFIEEDYEWQEPEEPPIVKSTVVTARNRRAAARKKKRMKERKRERSK